MKKITGKKQKEEFRRLLEEAMKHCSSTLQAFQLANAKYQEEHGNNNLTRRE